MEIPLAESALGPTQDAAGCRGLRRRALFRGLAVLGVDTATFRRTLAAQAGEAAGVTPEMIHRAERNAGEDLTKEEREAVSRAVRESLQVPPSLSFIPDPGLRSTEIRRNLATPIEWHPPRRPRTDEELALLPVTELSALLRARRVSSTELTELYLSRLRRFDPLLKCVVTLTEPTAREQARKADAELAAGIYRGPLHGIPWGAKDIMAYPGYPTTWGAAPLRDQILDKKATVIARLEKAGAVLVAKLSLGAFATGDCWYGGQTKNPWNPCEGSSGSSAGSAAAAAAGLVGFALGGETLGSIISPCQRCGASGLRPTFGRVSRDGCLPLSWSLDKIGPIARSLEDCALVLDAIHGADQHDPDAIDRPFRWPPAREVRGLRIGYFEDDGRSDAMREALKILRGLEVELVPIKLPAGEAERAADLILRAEAHSVFKGLTREHTSERAGTGPRVFPRPEPVSAADYLWAARVRTLLMQQMAKLMDSIDVYAESTVQNPFITNLTGHPMVVLPFMLQERQGRKVPGSVTFTGRLFDEEILLSVAHAFQQAAGDHLRRPPLERYLSEKATDKEVE